MIFLLIDKISTVIDRTEVDGKWEFKHILEKKPKAVIFWGFFITHFSTKAAPPNFPSFSEEPHHPHQTPEESHFAQN